MIAHMHPCYMSAGEIARLIRHREMSAVECLEYFRRRVERFDPAINAVVVRDWERAYADAQRADQQVGCRCSPRTPARRAHDGQGIVGRGRLADDMG
jgi:Asp-tRNA(Asn)/Glu-tRNA(Gln) amidotransferase A subunit family amidase